jgi:hypothetical protein
VLAAVVGAVFLAGLITAGVEASSSGSTSTPEATGAASTTTVPAGNGLAAGSATVATATTAPAGAGSTPTTAAGEPTTAPAATVPVSAPPAPDPLPTIPGGTVDPGQPTATAPGTYHYTLTMSGGSSGTSTQTLTEAVTTTSSAGGAVKQTVVDNEPEASSEPGDTALVSPQEGNATQNVEWSSGGFDQLSTDLDAGGQTIHCVWSPPVLELPPTLGPGVHWTLSGQCPVSVYGQSATVQLTGQGTVNGSERVKVGSDTVAVWIVQDSYTAVVHVTTFGVSITLHHVATDLVAGRLGLIVQEDASDSFTYGGSTTTTDSHQILQSIHPA